jgi:hypothetical protein
VRRSMKVTTLENYILRLVTARNHMAVSNGLKEDSCNSGPILCKETKKIITLFEPRTSTFFTFMRAGKEYGYEFRTRISREFKCGLLASWRLDGKTKLWPLRGKFLSTVGRYYGDTRGCP